MKGTEPQVGDTVGFRDKPNRTIVGRFTDVCGVEWIDYTITKQISLEAWNRAMRGAITIRKARGSSPPQTETTSTEQI